METAYNPSQNLKEKVAIVTGASKGIGRAIALRLGKAGAKVVVNYYQSNDSVHEVVNQIKAGGSEAIAVQGDIHQVKDMHVLFEKADEKFGKLDILINNAADFSYKPFSALTEEDFDHVFSINTKIPMIAMQEAATRMKKGGRIVNISSWATVPSASMNGLYVASKAALEQLTKSFAKELGTQGITINAVLPGYVQSDGFTQGATEEFKQMATNMSALGRLGNPEDIAEVVLFLVSEEAQFITGTNIPVTGGL